MKTTKYIFLFLLASVVFVSCEDLLEGPNLGDDPNTIGGASTLSLLGQAELVSVYLTESDASRYAGINSNYIAGVNNQWAGYESYEFIPTDFNALWGNLYLEGLTQARLGKAQAESEGDSDGQATASFFEALYLGELAASFGNVPDSEAISTIDDPAYDAQATVLNHAIDLLDDAISLGNGSTQYITDAIGGTTTTSNLGRLAHSLKARYYLTLKDYGNALISANAGISSNGGGLLTVHDATPGARNLYYEFTTFSRQGDTATIDTYLEDLVDPAGPVSRRLATPGEAARYAFYYDATGDYNTSADGIFAEDASLPIVSWYETRLIAAEAAFRTSGDGAARTALNEVRAALATQYSADFPASTASGNELLLHILEEKYITIYPAVQTMHDIGRTNNALGVRIKTGSQQPQRFLYPQTEISSNSSAPSPIPSVFVPTPVNQ